MLNLNGISLHSMQMKKKVHKVGTIRDSELKKKIRKPICPPSFRLKDKTEYKRKGRNSTEND